MTAAEMVAEALASSSTPDRGACRSCECEQTTEAGDVGSYCCCCETWRARMDAALAHPAERASRAEERAARAEADLRRMETRALTDALDALREVTRG